MDKHPKEPKQNYGGYVSKFPMKEAEGINTNKLKTQNKRFHKLAEKMKKEK